MTGTIGFGQLPPEVDAQMADRMLAMHSPELVWTEFSSPFNMNKNAGRIWVSGRYLEMEDYPVPLNTEGPIPAPSTLSRIDVDVEPKQYGAYFQIASRVTLQVNDGVLNGASQVLGLWMRRSEDVLARDCFIAGSSAYYCSGSAMSSDRPTPLTRYDIDTAITTLLVANGKYMSASQTAMDRFGTGPVKESFPVIAHSRLTPDIQAIDGFQAKASYPRGDVAAHYAELGAVNQSRWFTTTLGSFTPNASKNNKTVYNCVMQAQNATGVIILDGTQASMHYSSPEIADPRLRQFGIIGNLFMSGPARLDESWLTNIRCTLRFA